MDKSEEKSKKTIHGICISARDKEDEDYLAKMIKDVSSKIKIINFNDVVQKKDSSLLDEFDYFFPYGGDGTVAWLVKTFYETFGSLEKFKPLVPVIKKSSVGFLKQLEGESEAKFKEGFQKLLEGRFLIKHRTILHTKIKNKDFIAVNEIMISSTPVLGKYSVSMYEQIINGNESPKVGYSPITCTMADGLLVATSIGSTSWTLSHKGQINLNEDSLELVFIGGIHCSANFTLPRKPLKIRVEHKNPIVTKETVNCYNQARKEAGLCDDPDSEKSLDIIFSKPRVVIDGKLVAFETSQIIIDANMSVPFCILEQNTPVDKARKISSSRVEHF